jgi:hypothetical protein
LGGSEAFDLLAMHDWNKCWSAEEWRSYLETGPQNEDAGIRQATFGGRPFGAEEFIGKLEKYLKRSLRPGLPGRPKKAAQVVGAG